MISELRLAGVVTAESLDDPPEAFLLPEERAGVRGAVDERRREYTTVRHLARLALAGLGMSPVAVVSGEQGEPLWPVGVVGSMTHCTGYRAVALGLDDRLASIGIDAEPHAPLADGVLRLIATPAEIDHLEALTAGRSEVHWGRLAFSAKEAVFKAWFPLTRRRLGRAEMVVDFDPASDHFTAELKPAGSITAGVPPTRVTGRWNVRDGLIVAAVTISHY